MAITSTEKRLKELEEEFKGLRADLRSALAGLADVKAKTSSALPSQVAGFTAGQLKRFHIGSIMAARTSALVPASATGRLYDWDGTTWQDPGSSGDVTLYNPWASTIPIGYGYAFKDGGDWFAIAWDC